MEHLRIVDKFFVEDQISNSGKLNSEYRTAEMADDVYYSNIYGNFAVFAKVNTGVDEQDYSEISKNNRPVIDRLLENDRKNSTGQKLTLEELTQQFFGDRDARKIEKLPEAFFANGYITVQQKCADVFARFDLGATDLVPAKFYQKDRKTEIHGSFYVFNFGCTKQSLLPEQSTGVKVLVQTEDGPIWRLPLREEDGQVALSSLALTGPDLWFENRMPQVIFMSGRLRDALKAEKLDGPFKFFKCRVVEE
jgi:hypothetical protein